MNNYHYISSMFLLVLSILCYYHFGDGNFRAISEQVKMAAFQLRPFFGLHAKESDYPTEKEMLKLDLATIDMTEAQINNKIVANRLYHALKDVGFAYLVNIPGYEPDELLQATKWLFNQPIETKMKIAKKSFRNENENRFRGYFPVIPGGHSFKEAYEVGSFFDKQNDKLGENIVSANQPSRPLMRTVVSEPNVWPVTCNKTADKEFKDKMIKTFHFYAELAKNVMHLIAEGLGLKPGYFDSMFGQNQLSTLRLLHYPTRINSSDIPDEARDGDTLITTGEHFDTAFLTILATFENKGLQIKPSEDSPWLDVPTRKHGLVINIGKLLSDTVNNELKATNHRVIDLGIDRYSVPFFYEPNFDGDISKSITGKLINKVHKKYGPWMTNRTSQFAEYATTDFGIVD